MDYPSRYGSGNVLLLVVLEEEEEEEEEDDEEAGLPLSLLYVLYRRGGRSLTTNW